MTPWSGSESLDGPRLAMEEAMPNAVDDGRMPVPTSLGATHDGRAAGTERLTAFARYGAALMLVAVAVLIAFVADQVVVASSLTLIFVIPVAIAATSLGWGPSVVAVAASVLAFDFFFTAPYFTFRMTEPSEIWAAVLLLATSAIVSAVAGQSRRHALEARRAADQAQALQGLAHVIIANGSRKDVIEAAAVALGRIFAAPAIIFSETDGRLRTEAAVGGAVVASPEVKAAASALEAQVHLRGETYPNDDSRFDFWPVTTSGTQRYVLAVDLMSSDDERPADPERFIEVIEAYVASRTFRDGEG